MKINNTFDGIAHTVQLSASNFVEEEYPYFVHDKNRQRKSGRYKYIGNIERTGFNPRKLSGIKAAITRMENEPQLIDPKLERIDYAADDYFNSYNDMLKVNLCLISLAALNAGAKNNYRSISLLQPHISRTIKFSTKYLEIEYYNKLEEERTKNKPISGINARFEYRAKALYDLYKTDRRKGREPEFVLNNAILHLESLVSTDYLYEILQNKMNDELLQGYSLAMQEKIYSTRSLEFITENRAYIWTRSQLIDLYTRMGYSDPVKQATRYKASHKGFKFVSYSQLRAHVNDIVTTYKRMIDVPNTMGGKIKK